MDSDTQDRKSSGSQEVGRVIAEVGGLVDETHLTLGIYGENLDPDEISQMLQCEPSSAHRRGDRRGSGPASRHGAWLLKLEAESPIGPEELVSQFRTRVPPIDDPVWSKLRERFKIRLSFTIFTTNWNKGFELSAASVQWLNALGAGLGFSIYADGE